MKPSPAGAVRERAVPCRLCRTPTWNASAMCDKHPELTVDVERLRAAFAETHRDLPSPESILDFYPSRTQQPHPIECGYVEQYWLPILGPTSLWLARMGVRGFCAPLSEIAGALGVTPKLAWHAAERLARFHIADLDGLRVGVHTRLPDLRADQVARLPASLRAAHGILLGERAEFVHGWDHYDDPRYVGGDE